MADAGSGHDPAPGGGPAAPARPVMVGGMLDGINGKLATLGAIVTAIVGFNSALTSCSKDTVARYEAFRGAVTTEESFWKDRYTEYVAISSEQNKDVRRQKLFAIAALAQHPVPSFAEYSFGLMDPGKERKEAVTRLSAMRETLLAALATDRTGDPAVAAAVQQSVAFEREQAETVSAAAAPDQTPAPGLKPDVVTAQVDITPTTVPQTLSLGKPSGWDIDLFWCAGGGDETEKRNYALALDRARRLGSASTAGRPVAPGVTLGRIRLRVLPELKQGGRYPALGSGNTLSVDGGNGEPEAAAAVLSLLNKVQPAFNQAASDAGSRFYLSGYVCNAGPA